RPVLDQLHPGSGLLLGLRARGVPAGWCLVGDGAHAPGEVEDAYGVPVFGVVPNDPRGAALVGTAGPARKVSRTAVVRAAHALASHLHGWLHPAEESASDVAGPAGDDGQAAAGLEVAVDGVGGVVMGS
ncbi:MAG TPA: hypothetical protein VFK43_07785, partial [Acidimicrobiales bacterium]|nr:hypothetical protein [Acidimicrobiales bacterium]